MPPGGWLDLAWVVLCLLGLAIIPVDQPHWGQLSFYLIWVSFALLYGLRAWHVAPQAADAARSAVSAEKSACSRPSARILDDASRQLKTPITIALGHAEAAGQDLPARTASAHPRGGRRAEPAQEPERAAAAHRGLGEPGLPAARAARPAEVRRRATAPVAARGHPALAGRPPTTRS